MTISIRLDSVRFSGGQAIRLEPDTIAVLVGPNNSGKSRALSEILWGVGGWNKGSVVTAVESTKLGDSAAAREWVEQNTAPDSGPGNRIGLGGRIEGAAFVYWPEPRDHAKMALAKQFCLLATAEHRFDIVKPASAINPLRDAIVHPVHYLLKYQELERKLDDVLRRVFGEGLVVNWASGTRVQVHIGTRPQTQDRVSPEYLRELDTVPLLEEQGDGIKSFVGCTFQVVLGPWSVVLLDEPEVFLHPPQAELLGYWLATEAPTNRQLVVATHSSDLIRGLLRGSPSRVKLVRLERDGPVNSAHVLESKEVGAVSSDPVLRFTNLLDSLFYMGTVLCESDADCRFYDAVLESIQTRGAPRPLFVPVGGKQAIAKFAKALTILGVSFHAVTDFDALNDQKVLAPLWSAFGGNWADIERHWRVLRSGVETGANVPLRGSVRSQLTRILQGAENERISDREASEIRELARVTTGWAQVKRSGLMGLPQGAAADAGKRLLELMAQRSLHIVPCGEVERFVPEVGGHSGDWVSEVLDRYNLAEASELEGARRFVRRFVVSRDAAVRS